MLGSSKGKKFALLLYLFLISKNASINFRFWILDFGLKRHGAWGMAHGVENLLFTFSHHTPTLCALRYTPCHEPFTNI
jgi:hypothetical protein